MVLDNICYLLNNFVKCSAYENVIFCWVMHEQSIIDSILCRLDTSSCDVKCISLLVDEDDLKIRILGDVEKGIRQVDVIERSLCRLPLYNSLNTVKIDTSRKNIDLIAAEIMALYKNHRVNFHTVVFIMRYIWVRRSDSRQDA